MIDEKLISEGFPFWENLTEHEKSSLVTAADIRVFTKGDMVHSGGIECTGVLSVVTGRLRAFMLSDEGKEITLFRLMEGDCCMLSASCIMKNISFDVHVAAEIDTELIVVSPSFYDKLAKENPSAEAFMNEIISTRFSEVMWVVEQVLFMKMDRRVALFLIDQSAIEEGDTISLTHEEIASHLGTAREVISRTLKYLANEGYIAVSRKGVKLLDRKGLLRKFS